MHVRAVADEALVAAALTIGRAFVADAVWRDGRCNWLGRSPDEALPGTPPTLAALGCDLYAGTAGVGLFLAELGAATGDADVTRTAIGGLRHALARAKDTPRMSPPSLYCGWIGIAYAAVRAGTLLERDDLCAQALALVADALAAAAPSRPLDVVLGDAGAILGLLAIDRMRPSAELVAAAIGFAERIAAAAVRDGERWSWPSRAASGSDLGPRPLTGFAHGAAGIGLALCKAGHAGDRPDLRRAGENAFRYEDAVMDPLAGNWPDFRVDERGAPIAGGADGGSFAWCHGAPGCGLARLGAMMICPDASAPRAGASVALTTTLAQVRAAPVDRDIDVSLCHGVGGLTETLLVGASVLEDRSLAVAARALWAQLAARHAAAGSWPSGLPSKGRTLGLMLGTAGAGYALLRAAGASPSVLLL